VFVFFGKNATQKHAHNGPFFSGLFSSSHANGEQAEVLG
jgi:hypothetical protein